MGNKKQSKDLRREPHEPPAWLIAALRASREIAQDSSEQLERPSSSFRKKCREAAYVALAVAKLRKECARVGFAPVAFDDYIRGLAKTAGVSLSPVLKWLGIGDLARPDAGSAGAFARFGQELGLGRRQTLAHVRIGIAASMGYAPLAGACRSRGMRRGPLEQCDSILERLELKYDPEVLSELRRIESEIRSVYGKQNNSEG